ncbi:putative quinol monooxygenase [Lysobacter gummosus]|uniref:putative quinol monooxygenase n=1 Tax=Lysobacter gummosus TaxID=262324 RepID=UPI00363A5BB5
MPAQTETTPVINIAVLKARPGQRVALAAALIELVAPTRDEQGCLDYTLFELANEPGTFYMRESFADQGAFQVHIATPHFKAFQRRFDELLGAPLRLIGLRKLA